MLQRDGTVIRVKATTQGVAKKHVLRRGNGDILHASERQLTVRRVPAVVAPAAVVTS